MDNGKSRPLSRVSGSPICVPSGSSPFRMRSNVAVSTVPDSPRSFAPSPAHADPASYCSAVSSFSAPQFAPAPPPASPCPLVTVLPLHPRPFHGRPLCLAPLFPPLPYAHLLCLALPSHHTLSNAY